MNPNVKPPNARSLCAQPSLFGSHEDLLLASIEGYEARINKQERVISIPNEHFCKEDVVKLRIELSYLGWYIQIGKI